MIFAVSPIGFNWKLYKIGIKSELSVAMTGMYGKKWKYVFFCIEENLC